MDELAQIKNALDHAQQLGFIEWWEPHGTQVKYAPVRGRQPAGYVIVGWSEAKEYLVSERLYDPETKTLTTP